MKKIKIQNQEKEPEVLVPGDLRKALKDASLVEAVWKGLTPLARWDFIIWVNYNGLGILYRYIR